jgi:hypothetical protein
MSTSAEGSKIWPIRPLAQISALTASSQAGKSDLEVRIGIWETVGKFLEFEEPEDGVGEGEEREIGN